MYNTKLEDFESEIIIPIVIVVQNSEQMNQIFKSGITKLDFAVYNINLFLNELKNKNKNRFKIDLGITTINLEPKIERGMNLLEDDFLYRHPLTSGSDVNLLRGVSFGLYLTTNQKAKYFNENLTATNPWVILFAERKHGMTVSKKNIETFQLEKQKRLNMVSFVFDDLDDENEHYTFSKRGNTLLTEDKIIELAEEIIIKSIDFYLRLKK